MKNPAKTIGARYLIVLVLVLYGAAVLGMPSQRAPERMVHEVTLAVTQRLAESADRLEAEPDYVKTIVADLVLPHFNFPSLAAAVLAEHWDELSTGEQRCMTNGIRERLVERYARALLEYEYTNIVTDKLGAVHTDDPVYVTQTALTPHPQPLSIRYKMVFIDDTWKVVDLIVAGGEVRFKGIVQGDVHIAGGEIRFQGFCQGETLHNGRSF